MSKTRTISATEFKATCLRLMDEVRETGEEITVTKRGKPIARMVPVEREVGSFFGAMKGTATTHGDIIGPFHEDWKMREE